MSYQPPEKARAAARSAADTAVRDATPAPPAAGASVAGALPYGGREGVADAGIAGPTRPLPYRGEMEQAFGASFSHVRAHGGEAAAEANRALSARAYTRGSDIAFGTDAPDRALVAHELAHTIQQSGGRPGVQRKSQAGGGLEAEADEAAAHVLAGKPVDVSLSPSSGVQTWGGSDHYMIGNRAAAIALGDLRGQLPEGIETTTAEHGYEGTDGHLRKDGDQETLAIPTGDGEVSYGAASRYSGDYLAEADELNAQGKETDAAESEHLTSLFPNANTDYVSMVANAATNANHFYPIHRAEYLRHHAEALGYAWAANSLSGSAAAEARKLALQREGFGAHFLQDAFASGHFAPRALDAIGDAFGAIAEASSGLDRTKTWHDFFCMLPKGLPTTEGYFHGDYSMDGNDLEHVALVAADSLTEVLSALAGRKVNYGVPGRLPDPDFGAIMADPVAGPGWRAMMGEYEEDLGDAKRSGEGYETSAGTRQKSGDIVGPIDENVYGGGASTAGPTPENETEAKAYCVAKFEALQHYMYADFVANRETRLDDHLEDASKGKARFTPRELEDDFHLFSDLARSLGDWHRTLAADDKDRKGAVLGLLRTVQGWISQLDATEAGGVKGQLAEDTIRAEVLTAVETCGRI